MHFVDQDVVFMYTLYLIMPALILLICNSAPPMKFLKVFAWAGGDYENWEGTLENWEGTLINLGGGTNGQN